MTHWGKPDCKFRLASADPEGECRTCDRVRKPGPMDDYFSYLLGQLNRKEMGMPVDSMPPADVEAAMVLKISMDSAREKRRKNGRKL